MTNTTSYALIEEQQNQIFITYLHTEVTEIEMSLPSLCHDRAELTFRYFPSFYQKSTHLSRQFKQMMQVHRHRCANT